MERSLAQTPVRAAAEFSGVWRCALIAYKERRVWGLARPLGRALAWAAAGLLVGPGPVSLVPVPSARSRIAERGEDVTRLLALRAATLLRRAGVAAQVERALRHRRRIEDQAGLGRTAREVNLHGSLRAPIRAGPPVIVVDDIVTSGATLTEAFRALRAAGRPVLGAAVVAATPKRAATT